MASIVCCPLCSFRFDEALAACNGCPLARRCSLLRCPNCRYEFAQESKIAQRIFKWFQKKEMEDGRKRHA